MDLKLDCGHLILLSVSREDTPSNCFVLPTFQIIHPKFKVHGGFLGIFVMHSGLVNANAFTLDIAVVMGKQMEIRRVGCQSFLSFTLRLSGVLFAPLVCEVRDGRRCRNIQWLCPSNVRVRKIVVDEFVHGISINVPCVSVSGSNILSYHLCEDSELAFTESSDWYSLVTSIVLGKFLNILFLHADELRPFYDVSVF